MKLRMAVMVAVSLAVHAWLLWAMPAQDVQAPSGVVALKLGQMKLASGAPAQPTPPEQAPDPAVVAALDTPQPVRPEAQKQVVQKAPETVPEKALEKAPQKRAQESKQQRQKPPEVEPAPVPEPAEESGAESDAFLSARQASSAPASTQQSVSEEPVLVDRPAFASPPGAPDYPELARQRRQQGTVVVEVQLDYSGAQVVRRLLQSSGVDSLDEAALKAVAAWQFLPYRENGRARPSRVRLPVRFAL